MPYRAVATLPRLTSAQYCLIIRARRGCAVPHAGAAGRREREPDLPAAAGSHPAFFPAFFPARYRGFGRPSSHSGRAAANVRCRTEAQRPRILQSLYCGVSVEVRAFSRAARAKPNGR